MADANIAITLATGQGGGIGPAKSLPGGVVQVYCNIAAGATYATNGNPVPLTAEGLYGKLVAIQLLAPHDGTRNWVWNQDAAAPKLKAYDAFATEEGNGTDTSTVTLAAILHMKV